MSSKSIRKLPIAILAIGLLFAINANSALAAPSVKTEIAVEVTDVSATLNATLTPEGHRFDYVFAWGLTSVKEEMTVGPHKFTDSASPVAVSHRITGLTPNTKYYFLIAAKDLVTNEILYGDVLSFTTQRAAGGGMRFFAANYPATIGGSFGQETVFSLNSGNFWVNCTTRTFGGELSAASNSLTLLPKFERCSAPGGTVTVTMNSCRYLIDIDQNFGVYSGSFAISCSNEGDAIEIDHSAGITIRIPAQSIPSTSAVNYQNTGPLSNRSISVGGWASNLKWTCEGFFCYYAPGLSGENGVVGPYGGPYGGFKDTTLNATNSTGGYNELFVGGQ